MCGLIALFSKEIQAGQGIFRLRDPGNLRQALLWIVPPAMLARHMMSRLFSGFLAVFVAGALSLQAQTPPVIVSVDPNAGPVPNLTMITIQFSQAVTNVDAADLLVDGLPATNLQEIDPSYYIFQFFRPKPNGGTVHVSWSATHDIVDVEMMLPFDGMADSAQWDYIVPDIAPPTLVSINPPPNSFTNLSQITVEFSEPVIGVNASDLRINGIGAVSVTGGPTTYTFTFQPVDPIGGTATVDWNSTNGNPAHGITDVSSNEFGAGLWFYFLPDLRPPRLVELRPSALGLPFNEVRAIFNEGVTNVDASDLLLNGNPALNVSALTNFTVYVFRFAPVRSKTARLEWAAEHGIRDADKNVFQGGAVDFSNGRTFCIFPDTNSGNTFVNFSNRFFEGVCTIDAREGQRWVPTQNFWVTQRVGQATLTLPATNSTQFRLRALSVAPGNAFVNLARAYGNISTVAGNLTQTNSWLPEWEGTNATEVRLANPCCAVADDDGNIYVAERDGHAVDKITPDGKIFTLIGQHRPGFNADDDRGAIGRTVLLHMPSGLFIAGSNLYVLDAGNHRVRTMGLRDPSQWVTNVFVDFPHGIGTNAHGLYVGLNKAGFANEAYFGVGGTLRYWDKVTVTNFATGLGEIRSVVVNPDEQLIIADSFNHRVYRIKGSGRWGEDTVIAGTGFPNGNSVGGDADEVALPGASSVAYLPIGGFFVGLDQGARVWYVDADDTAVPFIFGQPGAHEGDGKWFRSGGQKKKISNVESVHIAPSGDIILVEGGVVRKIQFLRKK